MTTAITRAVIAISALSVVALYVVSCNRSSPPDAKTYAQTSPSPATPKPVDLMQTPVSEDCKSIVKTAEGAGLVRAGSITRDGAVILTDARWAKLDFPMQESIAKCLSHYIAGSQNHWVKKITFRNQAAGVTYGTMENTRYTLAE